MPPASTNTPSSSAGDDRPECTGKDGGREPPEHSPVEELGFIALRHRDTGREIFRNRRSHFPTRKVKGCEIIVHSESLDICVQNGAIGRLYPPMAPFPLPAPRSVTKSHETSIKVISVLSYLRFDIRFPLFFLCATTGWNGCDDSHSTNTQKERKKMNQIILTTPEEPGQS